MGNAPADQPGPEPSTDVRRQMPNGLSRRQVYPHLGVVLHGWIGDEAHLVPLDQMLEMTVAAGEDGAVDRGTETGGLSLGKRRRGCGHRVGLGGMGGPPVGGPALLD